MTFNFEHTLIYNIPFLSEKIEKHKKSDKLLYITVSVLFRNCWYNEVE